MSALQSPDSVIACAVDYPHRDVVPLHVHRQAQLLYAAQGVIRVRTPGAVWVVPPHSALWVPSRMEHALEALGPVSLRAVLVEEGPARALGGHCRLLGVTRLLRELLLSLNALQPEGGAALPSASTRRGHHVRALILEEIAAAPPVPIDIPWPRDRRLAAVCEAVLAEPGSPNELADWAAMAGASARTLIRLFPRETGLPYRRWVQQVQVAHALCRLAEGAPVARIAAGLGYASPSAFSAMFRRLLGAAPQRYLGAVEAVPRGMRAVAS